MLKEHRRLNRLSLSMIPRECTGLRKSLTTLLCCLFLVTWWDADSQAEKQQFLDPYVWSSQTSGVGRHTTHVAQRLRRRQISETRQPSEQLPSPAERLQFTPLPDRWRIGYKPNILNPYQQNVLKGDLPLIGQHTFFALTGISDTLFEFRQLPIPAGVSTQRPDSASFFGKPDQLLIRQYFLLRVELFSGDTAFKPLDWLLAMTPAFSINYLDVEELGVVNADVRHGTSRRETDVALQEAFFEYHLANLSPRYDFISTKLGIQLFNSDFRSFLFNDTNLGARVFGNLRNNRYQYNILFFEMLEKDTNSELNTFALRKQQVVIANVYWQDFIWLGYTTQFSLHYNRDQESRHFDDNDFLVRPDPVGDFRPHEINVVYLGWTSEGHIGRFNVTHAFYQAIGRDDHNPLAGRRININAQLFALELSMDIDWLRPKVSLLWTSGDSDPTDGKGRGFDTILDRPNFAGGAFSFWQRQNIRLLGVGLVQRESLVPNLRSNKLQGQVNFVNPGLLLLHAGLDIEALPQLRTFFNFSYLRFTHTESLKLLLQQPSIDHEIGFDLSFGFFYRPLLNNNIMLTGGVATLIPGNGFKDLLTDDPLWQGFVNAIFTY